MVFDQIMALTKGGPAQSTESISYLIYQNGMAGGQFGFQSANAVIFFLVIVAISVTQMTVLGKKEEAVMIRGKYKNKQTGHDFLSIRLITICISVVSDGSHCI